MYLPKPLPLLALVVLLGSQAEAQDGKPVIDRILYADRKPTTRAPQGGVIILVGKNFHACPAKRKPPCTHPGLSATVDGTRATIFAAQAEEIVLHIPQSVAPGRRKSIKITCAGRGSARAAIDVVSVADWKPTTDGPEGPPAPKLPTGFQITRFRRVSTGTGNSFLVEGLARNLPDSLRVGITLRYENRVIAEKLAQLKASRFAVTFGPYPERLLVGHYAAQLEFSLARQNPAQLRLLQKVMGRLVDEDPGRLRRVMLALKRVIRREYLSVGGTGPKEAVTPQDLAKQRQYLQAHTLTLARDCSALLDSLKATYASACRSYWKYDKKSGYDQHGWKNWLASNGFGLSEAQVDELQQDTRFANAQGAFRSASFERWARKEFLPKLQKIHHDHVAFNKGFIVPIDGRTERLGHYLIDNLMRLFLRWTTALYAKSEYEVPKDLAKVPFRSVSAPRVSLKYFAAKKRDLFKQVQLDDDD